MVEVKKYIDEEGEFSIEVKLPDSYSFILAMSNPSRNFAEPYSYPKVEVTRNWCWLAKS